MKRPSKNRKKEGGEGYLIPDVFFYVILDVFFYLIPNVFFALFATTIVLYVLYGVLRKHFHNLLKRKPFGVRTVSYQVLYGVFRSPYRNACNTRYGISAAWRTRGRKMIIKTDSNLSYQVFLYGSITVERRHPDP